MKAAIDRTIAGAVATFAAASHRHPRCVTPAAGTPATSLVDQQAARIVELEGQLATARGRNVDLERKLHDANNDLFAARGALEVIGLKLDLPGDTKPARVAEAALRRLG